MLRFAAIRAARAAAAARSYRPESLATVRSLAAGGPHADRIAVEMVRYALTSARSHKSDEAYSQAIMILEQGVFNLRRPDGGSQDGVGMALLAMSTLLYERGKFGDSIEKLQEVLGLEHCSLALRVAAFEGLIGLHLEMGQDVTSSVLADKCLQFVRNAQEDEDSTFKALHLRATAAKGLTDLVTGDLKSGGSYFGGCTTIGPQEATCSIGNVALSHGQFLHASGDYSTARDFYQKALQASENNDFTKASGLAAANMDSEILSLGAICGRGQVAMHLGDFPEAEETLTKALTKAEEHFGSYHPNVGVVLTCIAMMFGRKAAFEKSSSILIQEGLYRRAIDLLKAPSMDSDVADMHIDKRDIVALARGGYGQILRIQQNRRGEGERMRKWAERIWKNRRLSLAEALETSEATKVAIIDARVNRVI